MKIAFNPINMLILFYVISFPSLAGNDDKNQTKKERDVIISPYVTSDRALANSIAGRALEQDGQTSTQLTDDYLELNQTLPSQQQALLVARFAYEGKNNPKFNQIVNYDGEGATPISSIDSGLLLQRAYKNIDDTAKEWGMLIPSIFPLNQQRIQGFTFINQMQVLV